MKRAADRSTALDSWDRWFGRMAMAACCIALGVGIGIWSATPSNTRFAGLIENAEALGMVQSGAEGRSGDYSFFVNRRYLWVVRHSTGQAQFYHVPETESSEQPLTKSRVYEIDKTTFPVDQVEFSVSERNLELYLWVTNPTTGKVRFLRARRDGGFDESPVIDPASEF
ncbi:MAG: hypothetical protein KDC38_19625 [Planctomycetes bacterium]|nr:hypothetical protein [Planctomycetota bacterium]